MTKLQVLALRSSLFLPLFVDTCDEVTHDNTFAGFRVHHVRKYTLHHQTIEPMAILPLAMKVSYFSHYTYSIRVFSDPKSSTVPKVISRTGLLAYQCCLIDATIPNMKHFLAC